MPGTAIWVSNCNQGEDMAIANGVEFLNDIKFTVTHALYKEGYDIDKADEVAENVKLAIFSNFPGATLYIPNLRHADAGNASREKVLALFNEGKKAAEIIRLTGLSTCTVYTYIRNRNRPVKATKTNEMKGMKEILAMKLFTAKVLLSCSVKADVCKVVSESLQTFILKQWGGVSFSFPRPQKVKGEKRLLTLKDRADVIYGEYLCGATVQDLADKYYLDRSTVREIIRRIKRNSKEVSESAE
jgi:Mor family transcriptional regulator